MKHFIDPKTNSVYAYEEDGSQDQLIADSLVPIDEKDVSAHIAAYTPVEVKISQTKFVRDSLLSQSDWTQLPDVPAATKDKWKAYRQALRDITAQKTFPESVVWPTSP
jgi:hypothetical protein